jgi:FtsP/CotA-like multicopper oxidase with cupredoxin domain
MEGKDKLQWDRQTEDADWPDQRLNRRQFLVGSSTIAASALMPALPFNVTSKLQDDQLLAQGISADCPSTPIPPATSGFPQLLVESFIARSEPLTLNVPQVDFEINCPNSVPILVEGARLHKCNAPGPTLQVHAGGTIAIKLNNNLPAPGPRCPLPAGKHPWADNCYYTTDIHFHGLHVSPSSIYDGPYEPGKKPIQSSDDVLVALDPGTQNYPYCVVLPDFHAPATYWYHAHRHGSTAVQSSTGMVGAIIVEDPKNPELTTAVREDRDLVFIIQEIVDQGSEEEVYTLPGARTGRVFD